MTSQAVASISFLSDIGSDTLQASGRYGRVYDLQLQSEYAQQRLADLRSDLHDEIDQSNRAAQARGGFGSLTSTLDRVENHPDVIALRTKVEALCDQLAEAQAEVGGIVFLPATENLPEIEKRLATLNRKAAKIGSEPIILTVTDEKLVLNYKISDDHTRGYDFEHIFAVLSGMTPQIPGYEFLATVEPTQHGNVVKRIPPIAYGIRHNLNWDAGHTESGRQISDNESAAGQALAAIDLSRFHHSGASCEHESSPGHVCGRQCKSLFVVYNEKTGETKQVGRTCLRNFTGRNDPERVLKVLEQVWEFVRYASSSRGVTPAISTEDFLTHCATIMRSEAGYVKGLGHDAARNYYNRLENRRDKKTNAPLWIEPNEYDRQQALDILRWLPSWEETGEFATNVKIALADELMNDKFYGIAGAAYIARERWERGTEQRARQAAYEAANAEKQHIGTVGQRETLILTVTKVTWIADRYSYRDDATKPLLIMTDPDGNAVKWFASHLPAVPNYEGTLKGATFQVKATINRHEDDEHYGKSTIVTRAKFEKVICESQETTE